MESNMFLGDLLKNLDTVSLFLPVEKLAGVALNTGGQGFQEGDSIKVQITPEHIFKSSREPEK